MSRLQKLHPTCIAGAISLACMMQPLLASQPTNVSLPLAFEENRGQSSSDARFLVRRGGYQIYFSDQAVSMYRRGAEPLRFRWLNSAPAQVAGEARTGGFSHYLLGQDTRKWKRNIPHFARVRYPNLYPGIDLVYYGRDGELEYDLVVKPGAPTAGIRLQIDGARSVSLRNGELVLGTESGEVVHRRPVVIRNSRAYGQQ